MKVLHTSARMRWPRTHTVVCAVWCTRCVPNSSMLPRFGAGLGRALSVSMREQARGVKSLVQGSRVGCTRPWMCPVKHAQK